MRARAEHDERGRHDERDDRMREPVRKRRAQQHRDDALRIEAPVDEPVAARRLHPAVHGENPERRQQRAERDERRRQRVRPLRHAPAAEQQHAEERRFEEERGQHLVRHEAADHVRRRRDEAAPVRAELERHHDPRHHAHPERHREDPQPERGKTPVDVAARRPRERLERRDVAREPHGERGQQDVQRDDPRELKARQEQGVDFHHAEPPG